ncbi:MAG: MMPL family transporter [Bacteroidia bacterium]|nr:MMPL family transporter [Bacteroidia bacterium]
MNDPQKRKSILVLVLVLLVSIVAGFFVTKLKFNYDFEAFFPKEDVQLDNYLEFRNTFEYDNEFVLLGIENKKGIFRKEFLVKIDSLTHDLEKIDTVKKVESPTNIKSPHLGGLMPFELPVLRFESPEYYSEDSASIYASPILIGSIFPKNAKSICIYVKTADGLSKKSSDTLSNKIERAFKKYAFDEVHYVGRIVAQDVYLKKLQSEFLVFLVLSFCMIVLFLWISFRSLYGIIVPVCIVLVAILWTLGFMGATNKPIDVMCVMLPTMVFIAGMSDLVHFFSKYFEELHKKTEKKKIFKLILKEVGFPTFLTLISTVVGFLSLLFSSIQPIKEFGIYTSVGIVIAFILTYTLLPALLYLFTPKKLVKLYDHNNSTYSRMRNSLFWIFRNQKGIIVITVLLLAAAGWGISKVKVNNILLEDLSDKIKVKQDFNFFDKEYSGVRPFELYVHLKGNKKAWDYETLESINKIDNYLVNEYGIGFLFSPAILTKNLNKAFNDGETAFYVFPTKEDYADLKKHITKNKKNKDIRRIIDTSGATCRITGKMQDIGSLKIKERNKKFFEFLNKNIDPAVMDVQITGAASLMDKNNDYMVTNMLQGFAFSIVVIGFLTWFLHRSIKMVIVFIIPNFIPMVLIAGLMGFMGIELKAATSLVFSIAFGVATDDTIHFISRFKIELGYGKSVLYAFKRTYFETGRPIIVTTFILIGGFMSLMTSDFQSTFYFGFLICITLIVAVTADMFLLPVLLLWIMGSDKKKLLPKKNKRSDGMLE